MTLTLRRSRDDVFLIGEESLLTDQDIGPGTDPTITIEEGVPLARRPRSPRLRGSLHGARGIVLAGLGAGAVALLATLELGGGKAPVRPTPTSPPRSPLISRSAAALPARPEPRAHHPAARPAEVQRPTVIHHRPRRAEHQVPDRPPVTEKGPEREPTPQVAPVSPPAVTEAQPTSAPESEAPAATTTPTPPAPPPSSSGGGPAGAETFGFER